MKYLSTKNLFKNTKALYSLYIKGVENRQEEGRGDRVRPPGPSGQCDGGVRGESEAEIPHQPQTAWPGLPGRSCQVLPRRSVF